MKQYDNPGSRWLAENDPKMQRKTQRRPHNAPRRKPAKEPKDVLFKRESAFLMQLPTGSHWVPHGSGNGVVVHVPGMAPFWRKADGAIVK